MPIPRDDIEAIKDELRRSIAQNVDKFKRSVLRELFRLWQQVPKGDERERRLRELLDAVEKGFRMPPIERALLEKELREAQEQVEALWREYFQTDLSFDTELKPGEFEKIRSLHQVDFPQIQEEQRAMIIEEIRRAIGAGYGYEDIRLRLLKRGLSAHHAETLANTSIAQFDSAMMHEFSAQAGIERFLYDGVLHPNSRDFCKRHLNRTFTVAQIKKLDNGQGLPVLTSLGGYNCTHWWTPVVDESSLLERIRKKKEQLEADRRLIFADDSLDSVRKEYIRKGLDKKNKSISADEASSIRYYTGDGYHRVNPELRERGKLEAFYVSFKRYMNNALEKLDAYEGTVYRGTNLKHQTLRKYQVGKIVTESAFTSATRNKNLGFYQNAQVQYIILSKTGRKVERVLLYPSEKEIVFKAGTRFEVLRVEKKHGVTIITLSEV